MLFTDEVSQTIAFAQILLNFMVEFLSSIHALHRRISHNKTFVALLQLANFMKIFNLENFKLHSRIDSHY